MIESNFDNIKVLIADDEIDFASTLVTRLEIRKFKTAMVTTGEAALAAVADYRPDVLLLDLKMPDLDGLEVLAEVNANFPDVKVIILTGHGSFEVGHEGMELGAYDFVMKPVDLNLLIEKIVNAYEETHGARDRVDNATA